VLDKVRADIDTDYPHRKKNEKGQPVAEREPKANTLWERLGGEAGVTKIVDDFVNRTANDPKVDFFRRNKVKLDADHVVKMKRELVEQISQLTGGPLKYTGPDMKKVHKDMGITNEQFDAAAANLKKALEKNKVGPEDRKKILAAVESSRKEIVQPKQPEEKKSEEKKATDKKSEDNKPAGKASVSGKVVYQGKPVTGGIITFAGKNGLAIKAAVAADGTYVLNGVKPGEYKVGINTKVNPKIPQVPAKYNDPDKSGLTCNVKEGRQTLDLDLK